MDSERQVLPVEHEAITSGDNDSALGDIEVLVAFEIFEILHFLKTKISVSTWYLFLRTTTTTFIDMDEYIHLNMVCISIFFGINDLTNIQRTIPGLLTK